MLWNRVKIFAKGIVTTDFWKSYEEIVPSEQLLQTKTETYTVESYNGLIRHFLARFRRKTKCYSKSEDILKYSLMLLLAKKIIYYLHKLTNSKLFYILSCNLKTFSYFYRSNNGQIKTFCSSNS